MKRLLLGAATFALLPQLGFAQVNVVVPDCLTIVIHGDTELEAIEMCGHDDEIVSVGARIGNNKISDSTSPVSVISEADINARNSSHVTDLLRSLPGISINSSGPAGNLTQLRLRGSEANHVLVLIDGIKSSNPNTGEFDFAGLRAEDIRKIEVLHGEQSALYGSDAVGGVINIITRARDVREGITFAIEGGSRNTLDAQLSAVVPIKGAALSVNGNVFRTDGYDISGLGGEEDGSKSRNINVGLNNANFGGVTLAGKIGASKLEAEFDSGFPRLRNTNDELITDTVTGRGDAKFDFAGLEHLISGSAIDVRTMSPDASFRNDTRGKREAFSWAAKKTWNQHAITILAETEKECFTNFGGARAEQNQTESIRNDAAAADYRFDNDLITITASARYDFNDRFQNKLTWRIGGGYDFTDFGGRVRASIGTGVKNPTMTELFGFFPAVFAGNPDVKPERSLGYNIGYEQNLLGGDMNISIDYFHSDLENEIYTIFGEFDPVTFARLTLDTVANQTSDSTREGLEVEGRWDMTERIRLHGSATFLNASENGMKEIRRPDFLASVTATWQATDRFAITASADHNGTQTDSDFAAFPATIVTLDAYTLVGLNMAYNVNDIVTISLRGDNLLNEEYQEVVGYASQGRGIYAGLRARF